MSYREDEARAMLREVSMAYGVDRFPDPPEYYEKPGWDWNGDTREPEMIRGQSELDDDLDAEAEACDDE